MSEGSASPKRPRLEFDDNIKEDHLEKFKSRDQDDQGSYSRKRRGDTDEDDMKDCEDMISKNVKDAARREQTLVMRLTNKEQELQECMNQIQEMKQAQTQNTAQLRSMLLDPAINLVFQRMSKEMDEHKEKLKQKQNELNAWKFTPDSQTGMRLMGKCRMLLQENGELGKIISTGRTAKLEGEISLHKALVGEMKKNQKELDEFVGDLEEDVEGMQGIILLLQKQLKEAREQITRLQQENEQLRTLQLPTEQPEPGGGASPTAQPCTELKKERPLSTSPPPLSSHHDEDDSSVLCQPQAPSLKPSDSSLRVPSMLIPPVNSDSVLHSGGSAGDLSPDPMRLKVTPDSGIQTQEEDEETSAYGTDSPLVDEAATKLNSEEGDVSLSTDRKSTDAMATSDNHTEEGSSSVRTSGDNSLQQNHSPDEVVRTSPPSLDASSNHLPTANDSVSNSSVVDERTSPTADLAEERNGDIILGPADSTENESDITGKDEEVERTSNLNEEVKSHCVDKTENEDNLDKLTPSEKGDDSVSDQVTNAKCESVVAVEPENVVLNSIKSNNLTNGSLESVTIKMETD